jgi:hypothetical protein
MVYSLPEMELPLVDADALEAPGPCSTGAGEAGVGEGSSGGERATKAAELILIATQARSISNRDMMTNRVKERRLEAPLSTSS